MFLMIWSAKKNTSMSNFKAILAKSKHWMKNARSYSEYTTIKQSVLQRIKILRHLDSLWPEAGATGIQWIHSQKVASIMINQLFFDTILLVITHIDRRSVIISIKYIQMNPNAKSI